MEIAESDSKKAATALENAGTSEKQEGAQNCDTVFSGGESEDTERQIEEDDTSREQMIKKKMNRRVKTVAAGNIQNVLDTSHAKGKKSKQDQGKRPIFNRAESGKTV